MEGPEGLQILRARIYVLTASTINSAARLLRSANEAMPRGIANSSDVVGRHYTTHNNSAMMTLSVRRNETIFQKTVLLMDFYFGDAGFPYPMGCIMSPGKIRPEILATAIRGVPMPIVRALAERSFDWWIMFEALPDSENRSPPV